MTNNMDININNTASSCHIYLYNKELDSNISFIVSNVSLYTKDIQEDNLINAYSLDNTAIVEATTYTNSLLFTVDEGDIELVSEDTNRMAIYTNGQPIAQITTLSVLDEEGNVLRSSIQPRDNGVEVVVEEELVREARITIEFAPYLKFDSNYMIYLRSFGEIDYWYDMLNREMYTVNKYNYKESYIKLSSLHISGSSYTYQAPAMISETVFFSNYKKCFFKINGSSVTKVKDETSFFGMTYLYDNVWLTATKGTNAYTYNIIEFTDVDTATYKIKDTYTITVGKTASEQYYMPYVSFNYANDLRVVFYTYQFNSYLPATTEQYLCANIDKENKQFNFTDIEPHKLLIYKDDLYTLIFNWSDRKYYVNGTSLSGYYSYPTKPLTLRQGDEYYGYTVSSGNSSSEIFYVNLKTASAVKNGSVIDKMWNNSSYAGRKSIDTLSVSDTWSIFKDNEIDKRHIRLTTKDDFIIPEDVSTTSSYADLTNTTPIYLKREVIQNKKFLMYGVYSQYQLYQRDNVIASGITASENTNIEIRPYSSLRLFFNDHYILEEDRDFNIYTSVSDLTREVQANEYELAINEVNTIFDKAENKYDLSFSKWGDYIETFEDYPNTLIKWTNSTYNEHGLLKSDIRAKDGTYSGYMGREEKGGSSIPDYYSEFVTIGDKIIFDYYNSFTQYNQKLRVYVNGIQAFDDTYNSTTWQQAEISLYKDKLNTVKIFYEDSTVAPSNDKGFFIDNLTCKVPIQSNEAEVYFNSIDLGTYNAPQGINIVFNDLETSSDVTKQVYYSINGGQEWIELTGLLPNVDNIILKAVFTKTSDDAYVRFTSVKVMPREFEYIAYAETSRKVYSLDDIVAMPTNNNTISIESDGRYKLLFEDKGSEEESFEGDNKIGYLLGADSTYGTSVITEEVSASGTKCCLLTYNYSSPNYDLTKAPRIEFSTQSEKFSFKYKVKQYSGSIALRVYVNNVSKFNICPKNVTEFVQQDIELNPDEVSDVKIVIIAHLGATSAIYIDDIEIGAIKPVDYSYMETESIDMSMFPSDLKRSIEPVNLQSTHDLDITNLYSVDNGEWQPFIDTLPNAANVRVKTVFTKSSLDEVVDASFESIIIKSENIKTGEGITSYADLDRQVVKDIISSLATLRKVSYNNKLIVDVDTLRIVADYVYGEESLTRKVIAKEIKRLDSNRIVHALMKVDITIDTKRVVYRPELLYIPQLNANFKLSEGKLILTKQDF